jgi:hypothetical protein
MDTTTPAPPLVPEMPEPRREGFVRRLMFHLCDRALRSGQPGPVVNGVPLTPEQMVALVGYAKRHGFIGLSTPAG